MDLRIVKSIGFSSDSGQGALQPRLLKPQQKTVDRSGRSRNKWSTNKYHPKTNEWLAVKSTIWMKMYCISYWTWGIFQCHGSLFFLRGVQFSKKKRGASGWTKSVKDLFMFSWPMWKQTTTSSFWVLDGGKRQQTHANEIQTLHIGSGAPPPRMPPTTITRKLTHNIFSRSISVEQSLSTCLQ